MIKDIVVNLPVDTKHDVTTDFAASMAGAFNAHLAAIAFVHRPIVPGSLLDGAAAGIIQAQRVAAKEAAQAAIAKPGGSISRLSPRPSLIPSGRSGRSRRRRCSTPAGRS